MDLKKLSVRTVSGLIYAGLIIGCIFWGLTPFSCLATVCALLAVYEFDKITEKMGSGGPLIMGLDMLGVVMLVFGRLFYPLVIWVFIMLLRMTLQLYIKSTTPITSIAKSFMSQIYIGLPLGLMVLLADVRHLHAVLAIFILIWLNDTGAFLVGSMLGRHRLFERISRRNRGRILRRSGIRRHCISPVRYLCLHLLRVGDKRIWLGRSWGSGLPLLHMGRSRGINA